MTARGLFDLLDENAIRCETRYTDFMRRIIVYDDGKGDLSPLTDLRPVFDVRTGALTTLERLRRSAAWQVAALFVPDAIRPLARATHAEPVNPQELPPGGPWLAYNGRCVIPPSEIEHLAENHALIEGATGEMIAACIDSSGVDAVVRGRLPSGVRAIEIPGRSLLSRPWDVRRFRDGAIRFDLDLFARPQRGTLDEPPGSQELFERSPASKPLAAGGPEPVRLGGEALLVAASARVLPGAVLDLEHGPIVLDDSALVRPGAIVIGPVYIGPHTVVLERATIRPNTAIGPWCKVSGEISGTIFQGYSNKAHDGYLGDSWVGEWVNLGAGTTNSNLLNTYGEVVAVTRPGARYERTGEQFLGAVIGDHVKTAICTRLMTGCVLHIGGMFAATVPVSGATPPFAWVTDEGLRRYRLDKFVAAMRAMMARRSMEPTEAYLNRIATLHASGGGEDQARATT
jgi:UDP-N-acetylglucosamine diphosphorylase/glucosamine-1-phosphate N-acetyltransferase